MSPTVGNRHLKNNVFSNLRKSSPGFNKIPGRQECASSRLLRVEGDVQRNKQTGSSG